MNNMAKNLGSGSLILPAYMKIVLKPQRNSLYIQLNKPLFLVRPMQMVGRLWLHDNRK
jgi:hypothetical protein